MLRVCSARWIGASGGSTQPRRPNPTPQFYMKRQFNENLAGSPSGPGERQDGEPLVKGSGLRVQGSGFRIQASGFRVQGSGCRVQDFRVWSLGFRG